MFQGRLLSTIRNCDRGAITEVVAVYNQHDIRQNQRYTIAGFTSDGFVTIEGSGYKYSLNCFKVA